jgi:hypothetical protein
MDLPSTQPLGKSSAAYKSRSTGRAKGGAPQDAVGPSPAETVAAPAPALCLDDRFDPSPQPSPRVEVHSAELIGELLAAQRKMGNPSNFFEPEKKRLVAKKILSPWNWRWEVNPKYGELAGEIKADDPGNEIKIDRRGVDLSIRGEKFCLLQQVMQKTEATPLHLTKARHAANNPYFFASLSKGDNNRRYVAVWLLKNKNFERGSAEESTVIVPVFQFESNHAEDVSIRRLRSHNQLLVRCYYPYTVGCREQIKCYDLEFSE